MSYAFLKTEGVGSVLIEAEIYDSVPNNTVISVFLLNSNQVLDRVFNDRATTTPVTNPINPPIDANMEIYTYLFEAIDMRSFEATDNRIFNA